MTFDFDVVGWLMGKPAHLSASGDGDVTAVLDYDDGRHATVAASGLMPAGFPFTVGFRALFEQAVFELQTVFADGPPHNTFTTTINKGRPARWLCRQPIPTRSSCAASSIAWPARPIPRCSMPSGRSRQ